ncbi:MAG: hypothetical protein R3Y43_03645 [Alphaproteobacteria bacterium]
MYRFNLLSGFFSLFFMAVIVFLFFYAAILVFPFVLAFFAIVYLVSLFNRKDEKIVKVVSKVKDDDVIDAEFEVIENRD